MAVLPAQTFLFADLAGFTALTEAHGDEAAVEMCRRLTSTVSNLAEGREADLVKTIGDAVMIRTPDPVIAIELGLGVVGRLSHHGSPPVRVGIHSGPAIGEDGDWFGATVNLASRVSNAAHPGEVLLTEATRQALPAQSGLQLKPRGLRNFKHIPDRVPVYAAIGSGPVGEELEIDPVCRMAVDPELAAAVHRRHGVTRYFCSAACAEAYAAEPRRYLVRTVRARAARAAFRTHLRVFLIAQFVFFVAWGIGSLLEGPQSPWFLLLLVGWGIPLALHHRAVRPVL